VRVQGFQGHQRAGGGNQGAEDGVGVNAMADSAIPPLLKRKDGHEICPLISGVCVTILFIFAYAFQGYLLLVTAPIRLEMYWSMSAKLPQSTMFILNVSDTACSHKFSFIVLLSILALGHTFIFWRSGGRVRSLCIVVAVVLLILLLLEGVMLDFPIAALSEIPKG
jgi:hypothetical protein